MALSKIFTVACVQMTSGPDPAENRAAAEALIREARAAGADLILTPETTNLMVTGRRAMLEKARREDADETLKALRALAAELGVWLLAGSLVLRAEGAGNGGAGEDPGSEEKGVNRSLLLGPDGQIAARYDKIHMFDVNVPDGQTYRESRAYRPGNRAVVADLPWGRLGLSICYDLRFPYLYRALAHGGADFLSVPAAFTRYTGQAHWHVLLRARAIENGCFVFAPAQCGTHADGRETYGHSLIVAPWGEVLADGGKAPGITVARIDPAQVAEARAMIPALTHDRTFTGPETQPLRAAGE
ncbi:MAG: carbon-nitrogen hydrolase family protein [Alphaproteobacteria bacterium]|nr:MAG: carbon-nitrogen hydrolase family protein [Alphaproteobacteria bacterium]